MIDTTGIIQDITSSTSTVTPGNSSFPTTTTTTTNSMSKTFNIQTLVNSSSASTHGVITSIWAFIVGEWLNNIPQVIVKATGSEVRNGKFTIYDLVMGEYEFFNLNFYDMDSIRNSEDNTLTGGITKGALGFYMQMRNLSLAISLFVLLYIAIRMAISTVASDRAKYQNMLTAWFASIVLIFFMHYIIIIISYLAHWALGVIKDLSVWMGVSNIEEGILSGQITTLQNHNSGLHLVQTLIMITVFVYYEIKFLIVYLKRYFEMIFLITISPMVTVTYAIDKVGDNRAQAFQTWFKELSTKYAIQVVHAITYVLFIAAAGAIAQTVPIIAAFFLWAMGRAEKTVRQVVGLQGEKHFESTEMPKPPGVPKFLMGRSRKS